MEDLLKKIQEAKKICAQKKIDLETVSIRSLKKADALKNAIGLFYAYFDGFLPRVENYVTLNPQKDVVKVFSEFMSNFNWNNIGESDIEKFLTEYRDPRDDKQNILWQPMPISNVSDGPNKIDNSEGYNGFDPVCKRLKNGYWSFADVRGTISSIYETYKK